MLPFAESAAAALLLFAASADLPPRDSIPVLVRPVPVAASGARSIGARATGALHPGQDTIPKRRRPAAEYSDGYATRVTIHRRLSYAMLPLFAASYVSGDELLDKGRDAPSWARNLHRPAATATAVLFGANTVTGVWNLWEGRHDPNGRTRRFAHAALFTAASAGFTYAGSTLAEEAERDGEKRRQHRAVNLASMGVATGSWLLMLVAR